MSVTPEFGWPLIQPTDFVTDLPADFETFADAVDDDLKGLLGGTTGQVLTKNSATDNDYAFASIAAGAYTELATGSLTGASVTLSTISGSYKDLYLILRDWYPSVNNRQTGIQFNSDTGNNYFSQAGASLSELRSGTNQAASDGNAFTSFFIYDYADASHYKSVFSVSNAVSSTPENQNATQIGVWLNAAAITSITIKLNADNFSGGTYVLYGIK